MHIAQSVTLFLIAGLFEIGGGYLVWQWWRDQRHWSIGLTAQPCCSCMALCQRTNPPISVAFMLRTAAGSSYSP